MFTQKQIAIDIGSSKTKIVYGGLKKDKIEITEYEIIDTPEDSIKDGKIINANAIATALGLAFSSNKIKGDKLILNITGTGVITRDIQIPKSTEEEIASILKYEAQQYFPVDLENYVMDFKPLEDVFTQEGVFSRVQLVAVPIKQVEEYMKFSKLLKREITAIDINANSLHKFLYPELYFNKKNKTIIKDNENEKGLAVLNFGSETIGVNVFHNGILKFNRILLNGISDLCIGFINAHRDMTEAYEEAVVSKEEIKNVSLDLNDPYIEDILRPTINTILDDIQRFIDFYNSRNSDNRVQEVYLCGGGSRLKGLDNYLQSYFGMNVNHIRNGNDERFSNVIYKGKKNIRDFIEDYGTLVNAVGALVR